MKSTLKWGLFCLIIYAVFLVVKLPAVHVLSQLTLPSQVKLSGVSGTIWQGKAQQVSYMGLPLENVNWSLSALPLIWGEVNANVKGGNFRQAEQIALNGHISASQSAVTAQDLTAYIPAYIAMAALPLPLPVKAEGRFKINLAELNYDYATGCEQLTGDGQWLNAKVAGVKKLIDLGNFKANLGCEKQQVLVKVKQPNSLGLDAQVNLPANMKFTVSGRFKPADSLPKEVHQAALFFGNKGSDGYFPIKF